MSFRDLFSVIRSTLFAGLVIVLAIIFVDLCLYGVGKAFDLGFTTDVWGTYSSWAVAILPGIAIMVSTYQWIHDRKERDRHEVLGHASMLVRTNGETAGANWTDTTLFNGASVPVQIVQTSGAKLRDEGTIVCQPKGTLYFLTPADDIEVVVADHTVLVHNNGGVEYVGPRDWTQAGRQRPDRQIERGASG